MDIKKLSQLARIKLNKKEQESFGKDLESVLGYIGKLKEAKIENVPELTHILAAKNVFRLDEAPVESFGNSAELLEAAPEKKKGFVKVKKVFNGQD
ncbi:MAG: Asp-tRNA(Asn)/Glu-tRNA(Gln) amidotransferase subunit GatC [Candidatus Niyogibacteria bacterium]|nr:Asp-tRNA(Asn)/Glu-tRNA(Gln) amidotransferase subunit GatC [Candidatus Niyogibacteria bacterium]